jgi:hypothetical protein
MTMSAPAPGQPAEVWAMGRWRPGVVAKVTPTSILIEWVSPSSGDTRCKPWPLSKRGRF